MNGALRSFSAVASNFPTLLGKNVQIGKSRFYSTCFNCMKLNYTTRKSVMIPINSCFISANYSTPSVSKDLAKYLDKEIAAETEASKTNLKTIPSRFHGFEVQLNGSEVTLLKQTPEEIIKILLNVNHSLQDAGEPSEIENAGEGEENDLKSKPSFQIEIKRGDTVLRLWCSYVSEANDVGDGEEYGDLFSIDELAIYKGDWVETNYSIYGDVLDATIYDMLLGVLDEKGITDEFIFQLSELCTAYEHASYVTLLRDLKKFVS